MQVVRPRTANEEVVELWAVLDGCSGLNAKISCSLHGVHGRANVVERHSWGRQFLGQVFRGVSGNQRVVDVEEDVHGADHVDGLERKEEAANAELARRHDVL